MNQKEKPERPSVDYDEVSPTYDQRYNDAYKPTGIAAALLERAKSCRAENILEAGCGTGHWLALMQKSAPLVCGVDLSSGMLQRAREKQEMFHLVRADVGCLPFRQETFEMIFCVNAIHHFPDPAGFIQKSYELLRPGGTLSIVSLDPHSGQDRWFLYEYFSGTYETDLKRYPATATVTEWMHAVGFESGASRIEERITLSLGKDILPLDKNFTSQLSLLDEDAFADGIARIKKAITDAEISGKTIEFLTDISLIMTTGRKGRHHL
jgi:ubiquinone/menaquinone biosynthesis C-methylase UbiE